MEPLVCVRMFPLEGGLGSSARWAEGHSWSRKCQGKTWRPQTRVGKKQTLGMCFWQFEHIPGKHSQNGH